MTPVHNSWHLAAGLKPPLDGENSSFEKIFTIFRLKSTQRLDIVRAGSNWLAGVGARRNWIGRKRTLQFLLIFCLSDGLCGRSGLLASWKSGATCAWEMETPIIVDTGVVQKQPRVRDAS